MAEFNSSLFNKKSTEKLHSPEDLNNYVRVARPGVWVILAACALLICGLVVWGIFGTVYVNVTATGVRLGDEVCCYLSEDNTNHIQVGNDACVEDVQLSVASISDIAYSPQEVRETLGSDFLLSKLVGEEEWVYKVTFEGDGAGDLQEGKPLSVSITSDLVSPLELLFGSGA